MRLRRRRPASFGEHTAGTPELIDDALQHGAHRIGHGVRLRSDITTRADRSLQLGPLARNVYDHQIPLDVSHVRR